MKKLTLQIDRPSFQNILSGKQKVEHRYVYPSNQKQYVNFVCEGKTYATQDDIPTAEADIEVVPIKYDALYLINGRRKDAPRMMVEVKDAEFVIFTDEDGNDVTFEENGQEFVVCQVWYHLGEVISTENV